MQTLDRLRCGETVKAKAERSERWVRKGCGVEGAGEEAEGAQKCPRAKCASISCAMGMPFQGRRRFSATETAFSRPGLR